MEEIKEDQLPKEGLINIIKKFPPLESEISIDDFFKSDIRVGKVLNCVSVENSKKLLRLEVSLGKEEEGGLGIRTILSGISKYYPPESLIGKKVIVIANLAKKSLAGIESHGMILAGSTSDSVRLLQINEEVEEGTRIS